MHELQKSVWKSMSEAVSDVLAQWDEIPMHVWLFPDAVDGSRVVCGFSPDECTWADGLVVNQRYVIQEEQPGAGFVEVFGINVCSLFHKETVS